MKTSLRQARPAPLRVRTVDLIAKKRDGQELLPEEIESFVEGYTRSEIPDYQASAWLMAVLLRGMTRQETSALTHAMLRSGEVVDLSEFSQSKVDKHSTGGVGDKTSLVLAPLVAAGGLIVPMISGRGLGHTGGTLDKLESIPGFNVHLPVAEFRRLLGTCGCAMIGQTDEIAPADRKLYALRDVTATVESPYLICASIMSKKMAEGIDALVLDVKTGSGAFMKREPDAAFLAELMVETGEQLGTKVVANLVNAVGDWILIYGHLGFRALGIAGSGWSTFFARVYLVVVLTITLLWTESKRVASGIPRRQAAPSTNWARIDAQRIWTLLRLGLPAGAQILLEIGAFASATALCAKLGAIPLSGHEIALNCAAFTFMVPLGISSAAAVRVGHALGRGDPAGARRAGWSAILLGAGFMTCAGLVFVSAPRLIARAFSPDPTVIQVGAKLLLVAAAFQLFDGLQVVTTGALRGAGDTGTPMLANLGAYWVIGIPLGYFLCFSLGFGALGIWIGLCTGLVIVGSALVLAWHRKRL